MGLRPFEVRRTTLKDFNLMLTGYLAKQDREWDRTRHVMSFIASYSGMGATELITPQQVRPLPMDSEDQKKMITTLAQAIALLKEFQ